MDPRIEKHKPTVLVLDGHKWEALKVMRCLAADGNFRLILFSIERWTSARFSRHCSAYFHVYLKEIDKEGHLKVIEKIIDENKVDILLPVTFEGVEICCNYREILGMHTSLVPLPSTEMFRLTNDKWDFLRYAYHIGCPVPKTKLVFVDGKFQEEELEPDDIGFPSLLKPTIGGGGYGIISISNHISLEEILRKKNKINLPGEKRFILQEYIPGTDYCLNVFCLNGEVIAYAIQKSTGSSERQFGPQRSMEFVEDNEILGIGKHLLKSLKWNGVACIDFRRDNRSGQAKVTEFNPRLGQAVLGALVAGVNFPLLLCYAAIGKDLPMQQYHPTPFIHPEAHLHLLKEKFFGRASNSKYGINDSGLKFFLKDPLPEIILSINKVKKRFKKKWHY